MIEFSAPLIGYDLRQKAPLYARGGVREYWVVDALRHTVRVHRAPETGGYGDVEEYEAHDLVATLMPGIAVRLDDLGLPPPLTVLRP